jgi:hypothetical protein
VSTVSTVGTVSTVCAVSAVSAVQYLSVAACLFHVHADCVDPIPLDRIEGWVCIASAIHQLRMPNSRDGAVWECVWECV